jgi:hypothetical protein
VARLALALALAGAVAAAGGCGDSSDEVVPISITATGSTTDAPADIELQVPGWRTAGGTASCLRKAGRVTVRPDAVRVVAFPGNVLLLWFDASPEAANQKLHEMTSMGLLPTTQMGASGIAFYEWQQALTAAETAALAACLS